jgi:hypothetical protein
MQDFPQVIQFVHFKRREECPRFQLGEPLDDPHQFWLFPTAHPRIISPARRPAVKRLLSPMTNSAGLTSAGMAIYAAVVMIYNASHNHGVVSVPVIVAAVAAVAALYTRQKVTPIADPKDGNGTPLRAPITMPQKEPPSNVKITGSQM